MSNTPRPPYKNKFRVEPSDDEPRRYRYVIMEMDGRDVEASDYCYDDPIAAHAAGDARALRHRMHIEIGSEL